MATDSERSGARRGLRRWVHAAARRLRGTADRGLQRPVEVGDPLEAAMRRRLIFVISTGRSGTEYLTQVLGLFRDVYAAHEPEPSFTGAFRVVTAAPHVARQFWLEHKLPAIARTPSPIYAETSHLTCKGFLESAVELGLRPTLIHLVRSYRATARSMLALNTIPSRTYPGVRYYLGPDDNVFLPVDARIHGAWHDYQLCYWYCLEIGERARVYAERFAPHGIRVHRFDLENLRTKASIHELGERLELGPFSTDGAASLDTVVGRRTNTKDNAKRAHAISDDQLATWEREVEQAVARRPTGVIV